MEPESDEDPLIKQASSPTRISVNVKGNLQVKSGSPSMKDEEDKPASETGPSLEATPTVEGPKRYINEDTPKTLHNKDIEKLYPSIKSARAGELVYNEVQITDLEFDNVDFKMATRFISKAAKSDEEVRKWGLYKWYSVRTYKMGKRPGMSGADEEDHK